MFYFVSYFMLTMMHLLNKYVASIQAAAHHSPLTLR